MKRQERSSMVPTSISQRKRKHLGAVIGSDSYKKEYTRKKLKQLGAELTLLSEISKIDPSQAYRCFVAGFKQFFHKSTAGLF